MSQKTEAVHHYFGLSYASYLVLPRVVLQSMPDNWQEKFVYLIEEISKTLDFKEEGNYNVTVRDKKGKFISTDLNEYQRGRRRLPLKKH